MPVASKRTNTHTHTTPFLNADVCTLQTGPSRDPACSMPHPPSAEEVLFLMAATWRRSPDFTEDRRKSLLAASRDAWTTQQHCKYQADTHACSNHVVFGACTGRTPTHPSTSRHRHSYAQDGQAKALLLYPLGSQHDRTHKQRKRASERQADVSDVFTEWITANSS